MKRRPCRSRALLLPALVLSGWLGCGWRLRATESPPPVPLGYDAYRQWDRWDEQRIGVRTYLRSTYDRSGGNEGADASHFLYQLSDTRNVALSLEGPGLLCFVRTNHWHGSPWHYTVDGTDHVVSETATADPIGPHEHSVFMPARAFPPPLAWTWEATRGADLEWVPIPFEKSLELAYGRTHYGTGYFIYQQWVPGLPLVSPPGSWREEPPPKDVLDLIDQSGTDRVPQAGTAAGAALGITQETAGPLELGKDEVVQVRELVAGRPALLRALECSVPRDEAVAFGHARVRITWDGRAQPSVDAPLALFFGAGTLYNRDNREYLVKAFPMSIRYDGARVHLACSFPMPFFRSARIELIGNGEEPLHDIRWSFRLQPLAAPRGQVGYFHATYRDHPSPARGQDLVLLDTRQSEGGGNWTGSFVGTTIVFSDRANLTTLEGDPRFFFDDSQTPQAQGTGTEEWGGGGDYWGGRTMTLPFAGHPVGAPSALAARCPEDKIESLYRFLLADLMPFGKNALIRFEHGGVDESEEHYQTLAYWYGLPGASLVKTDELKVGDGVSERLHDYASPRASLPYSISSRYEWGVDSLPDKEMPLANPADYAEFKFEALEGRPYAIWVLGTNASEKACSANAFWIQFDEEIGTALTDPGVSDPRGFGTRRGSPPSPLDWSGAVPPAQPRIVSFSRAGRHRLRIQGRLPRLHLDSIWLSSTQEEFPKKGQRPPDPSPEEIVLDARSVSVLHGTAKAVPDSLAPAGRALEVETAPAPAPQMREIFAAQTDVGRKTTGSSEFTLRLRGDNQGVLLRRKLDYAFPNQRAEVYVESGGPDQPEWKWAGIWYLAGSNTCVYSNPAGELGAAQHRVEISNRRFRDDEFLIPCALTRGRSEIRVRVTFAPKPIPLFPGDAPVEMAWSELRYDAYCFVLP